MLCDSVTRLTFGGTDSSGARGPRPSLRARSPSGAKKHSPTSPSTSASPENCSSKVSSFKFSIIFGSCTMHHLRPTQPRSLLLPVWRQARPWLHVADKTDAIKPWLGAGALQEQASARSPAHCSSPCLTHPPLGRATCALVS